MCPKKRRQTFAEQRGSSRRFGTGVECDEALRQDIPSFWGAALIQSLSDASEAGGDSGEALLRVTQDALDHIDRTLEASEPPRPIVCGPGCVYCCHNQISVTPMEAFGLCLFLEENFDAAEHARSVESLLEVRDRIRDRSRAELYDMRRELVCVFLKNRCCGVYRARPVACRTWHSMDRDACAAAFESPDPAAAFDTYTGRREYGEQVQIGLLRGAAALGLEAGYLVMTRALAILSERDWRREMNTWLAGGKVFTDPGRL